MNRCPSVTRLLFYYLLFYTLLMIVGQVLFLFEETNRTIGAIEYTYLSILVGVVLGQYQYSRNNTASILCRRNYALALLLLGSLTTSFHWLNRDIWMDEYTMAYRLSGEHFNNIFQLAFKQQQPPLDYLLTYFLTKTFGLTEWSLRLRPILSNIFFLFLFWYWLERNMSKRSKLTLFLILLTIFHPKLSYYMLEARQTHFLPPLFMFYLILYQEKKESYSIFSLFFFLLMTCGMQPIILLGSTVLYSALAFLKTRGRLEKVHVRNVLVSFVIFLPLFFVTLNEAKDQSVIGLSTIPSLETVLAVAKVFVIDQKENWIIFTLCYFFLGPFQERQKSLRFLSLYGWGTLLYFVAFTLFIDWLPHPRYLIIIDLLIWASIISLLAAQKEGGFGEKSRNFIMTAIILLILLTTPSKYKLYRGNSVQMKAVYTYLESKAQKEDVALLMSFEELGQWRPDIWVSKEVYAKKADLNYLRRLPFPYHRFKGSYLSLEKLTNNTLNAFLVFYQQDPKEILDNLKKINDSFTTKKINSEVTVLTLPLVGQTNIEKLDYWSNFLSTCLEVVPPRKQAHILESLILLNHSRGDLEGVKKYREIYKKGNFKTENKYLLPNAKVEKKEVLKWIKRLSNEKP